MPMNRAKKMERLRNMAAEKKQSNRTDKDKWFQTGFGQFISSGIFKNYWSKIK